MAYKQILYAENTVRGSVEKVPWGGEQEGLAPGKKVEKLNSGNSQG